MGYTIVVVDDDALSLANAKGLLSDEDMHVVCIRSGNALLRYLDKNVPDLILLDIMMPDMDGFEIYNALRHFEEVNNRTRVPVMFLTGKDDNETEMQGLKAGASDFIRKPFNKDVLISRIQNAITNSRTIESLTEEATLDKLTGFFNKSSGIAKVTRLCKDSTGTLMIMDLDSFKLVNDLFGHDMGDRVLKAFSDIVRHNTRETDVISRIGGDEFMGFFPDISDESSVSSLTERLNEQLSQAASDLMGADNGIPLGISFGVVMIPRHGRDYASLFSLADNSLYTVKQNGKHGYSIYDSSNTATESEETDLKKEIARITKIVEERNDKDGAQILGRDSFTTAYRLMSRFHKDYGGTPVKILFSISLADNDSGADLADICAQFGTMLQNLLRKSDIIMQDRTNRFFVLLNNRNDTEIEIVINRVLDSWNNIDTGKNTIVDHMTDNEHLGE